jgi:hypothetical protein
MMPFNSVDKSREIDTSAQHGDHHGKGEYSELGNLKGHLLEVGGAQEFRGLNDGENDEDEYENDDEGEILGIGDGGELFEDPLLKIQRASPPFCRAFSCTR